MNLTKKDRNMSVSTVIPSLFCDVMESQGVHVNRRNVGLKIENRHIDDSLTRDFGTIRWNNR